MEKLRGLIIILVVFVICASATEAAECTYKIEKGLMDQVLNQNPEKFDEYLEQFDSQQALIKSRDFYQAMLTNYPNKNAKKPWLSSW